jgi:SAM-dependent methyltransferase
LQFCEEAANVENKIGNRMWSR